jgi:hypothetical protein
MAQYKQSDITNIYWASNEGFKGGRDPMGIQNSSIATYGKLLPGLTNLTKHIRYYSLYCWLLNEYNTLAKAEKERGNSIPVHQYNYIRRAELAMAFIMKDQGIGAVVGAQFVSQNRYKTIGVGVYDLANGADNKSEDKYWTFETGAFGQYYYGSMNYYDLVKIEERYFYLQKNGTELANAFCNSVDERVRNTFLTCVWNGTITEKEILELQPLAIHNIQTESEEWRYLNHLLIKRDELSSFRKETVYLLLRDLRDGRTVGDFVKNRFINVNKEKEIGASFGWYFYYLCEGFHYCIDSIFCIILNKIQELHNPPLHLLSQELVTSILSELDSGLKNQTVEGWSKRINENIDSIYDELKEKIKNEQYTQAAALSLKLLLRLFIEYEHNKAKIQDFENRNELNEIRGILSKGLKEFVIQYKSYTIPNYIKALVAQIMQEHTIIAIGKMGNTNSDLRKFILEEGRAVLVETREPMETSPRVDSLKNYLQDLDYLDNNDSLTNIAFNYIDNYGQ